MKEYEMNVKKTWLQNQFIQHKNNKITISTSTNKKSKQQHRAFNKAALEQVIVTLLIKHENGQFVSGNGVKIA